MADALSLRAAFGVTGAAQAPLAKRGKRWGRWRRNHPLRPPRRAVRAGEGLQAVRSGWRHERRQRGL